MDALINAGGKGTRMGKCGVEKPMLTVGGKPTIQRVLEAVSASSHVDRVLVSVSDNTPGTERFLHRMGVETLLTTDACTDIRIDLTSSGNRAFDQFGNDRVDRLERVGLEDVTVQIDRNELGLDIVT